MVQSPPRRFFDMITPISTAGGNHGESTFGNPFERQRSYWHSGATHDMEAGKGHSRMHDDRSNAVNRKHAWHPIR